MMTESRALTRSHLLSSMSRATCPIETSDCRLFSRLGRLLCARSGRTQRRPRSQLAPLTRRSPFGNVGNLHDGLRTRQRGCCARNEGRDASGGRRLP